MNKSTRVAIRVAVIMAVLLPGAQAWAVRPMSWKFQDSPNPSSTKNVLHAITMPNSVNAWAVGTYQTDYGQPFLPLIYRYNGTKWVRYSDGNPSYGFPLEGVAALSDTAAIAVGSIWFDPQGTTTKTLIERCC